MSLSFTPETIGELPEIKVAGLEIFVDPQLPPVSKPGERPGEYIIRLSDIRVDGVFETDLGIANTALSVGPLARHSRRPSSGGSDRRRAGR